MIARKLSWGLCLGVFGLSVSAALQAADTDVKAQCESLARSNFSGIQDAPTQITEAELIGPKDGQPGHCQVTGYVAPQVEFLLRLPLKDWNGKFLQLGCGGFCGTTTGIAASTGDFTGCLDSVRRGYACAVSNNGHSGSGGLWAYNNLPAELDHAYRAAHVVALAVKVIITQYYTEAPRKAYFWGCSTGGRQALMEAQRFPWDFDGIIAADPSLGVPDIHMAFLWAARALTDLDSGQPLFETKDLQTLHRAVIQACDLNDGVKDGLIGDPRACRFDVSKLMCKGPSDSSCLSTRQIDAARKIYSGPQNSRGEPVYTPMGLPGSELEWPWYMQGNKFAEEEFRYSGFWPNAGPKWKAGDFDFDHDYKRLGVMQALYSPVNPDLRQFKAAGGKLLAYTGWATHVPLHFVDYYETVERTMGGRTATQDFFRFFAIPGMAHCTDGEGAYAVDWLDHLERWVEQNQKPEKVIGAHVRLNDPDLPLEAARLTFPLDPARIEFTRPAYPYPLQTKYLGRGDPNDAKNFGSVH